VWAKAHLPQQWRRQPPSAIPFRTPAPAPWQPRRCTAWPVSDGSRNQSNASSGKRSGEVPLSVVRPPLLLPADEGACCGDGAARSSAESPTMIDGGSPAGRAVCVVASRPSHDQPPAIGSFAAVVLVPASTEPGEASDVVPGGGAEEWPKVCVCDSAVAADCAAVPTPMEFTAGDGAAGGDWPCQLRASASRSCGRRSSGASGRGRLRGSRRFWTTPRTA